MAETMSDAEAILARESFVLLFDRHFAVVHRYVHRRVGIELADDLAAETFARAFAARSNYDQRWPDARPWLLGIATNLIRHHHRAEERRWRAYQRSAAGERGQLDIPPGDCSREAALALGLAQLGVGEREVLLLYAWFDLSYEEIARALSVPVGTVRSRLNSARRRMRHVLGEPAGENHAAAEQQVARLGEGR